MSEMLGNQYFMGRHYYEAKNEFELELKKQPSNLAIKKKLIVCYTQTGQVTEALDLFHEVIVENINIIINTDPIRDDCPCPELIDKINTPGKELKDEYEINLVYGIIWLYCDAENSLYYFETAQQLNQVNGKVQSVISCIKNCIAQKKPIS